MTIEYHRSNEHGVPYWKSYDPNYDDLLDMVYSIGATNWYNFVIMGVPCEISPQWLAKHEHVGEKRVGTDKRGKAVYQSLPDFKYEYAVSYSIYKDDMEEMLYETDNVLDWINYYLDTKETGKCWREVEQLLLVDRRKPWEGTM